MKKNYLRVVSIVLSAMLLFSLAGCKGTESNESLEKAQLTISVSLGNNTGSYYDDLHDAVLDATGVDMKLVFNRLLDTSTAQNIYLENCDLPADIIISAKHTSPEIQKKAFLELSKISDIPTAFSLDALEMIKVDGDVYQLPFGSRLMGIGYNKTLMSEMGWELPETFNDLLELKKKCEEADIQFSVTADTLSGHGFVYLTSVCGADYICTPEGTEWLNNYLKGTESSEKFRNTADYFKKWIDEGIFGEIVTDRWDWADIYRQNRALFLFELTSSLSDSYSGIHYDSEGRVIGASYDAEGNLIIEKNKNGEFVELNDMILKYDETREDMVALERFNIPGAELINDEYGIMPWISESGESNCFVTYDVMNIALSKSLGEAGNEEKLEAALKVLEYMTTNECIKLQNDMFKDSYVATKAYEIDNMRLYSDYSEKIKSGYIMPWYYNDFDDDSIVNIGYAVNDRLTGAAINNTNGLLATMLEYRDKFINHEEVVYGTVTDNFDFRQTSEVVAVSEGISLQSTLDEAGIDEEVNVALVPYINSYDDIPRNVILGAVQGKLYKGNFNSLTAKTICTTGGYQPVGIHMTGAEIKAIVETGYDKVNIDFNKQGYQKLPYTCLTKGGIALEDNQTYLVAVDPGSLLDSQYAEFLNSGKVITTDDSPIKGDATVGMISYLEKNGSLTPDAINW